MDMHTKKIESAVCNLRMINYLMIILSLLHVTSGDSEGGSATRIRQVYVMYGSNYVYEPSGGNQKLGFTTQFAEKQVFDVYSDNSMRKPGENVCLHKRDSGGHLIFADCSLKLALTYDSEKQTYTSEEGCWTKADANIKIEACSSFALGFIQYDINEIMTTTTTTTTTTAAPTPTTTKIQTTTTTTAPTPTPTTTKIPDHSTTAVPTSFQDLSHTTTLMNSSPSFPAVPVTEVQTATTVFSSSLSIAQSYKTEVKDGITITPSSTLTETKTSTSIVNTTENREVNDFYLANPGQQCLEFCQGIGKICTNTIVTGNSESVFTAEGVTCLDSETKKLWQKAYDPSYYINGSICAGYIAVNESGINCHVQGFNNTGIRRLCKCLISGDEDNFGPWLPWSPCSASCNGGVQTRTRTCIVDSCSGQTSDQKNCNTHPCPIHGGFSEWSVWSGCTKTCGGGQKTRSRTCTNPSPQYGGFDCFGDRSKSDICNLNFCPVHGNWSSWTEWSACDKPCNSGRNMRWRFCNNPAPLYGGNVCPGNSTSEMQCNDKPCPAENVTVVDVKFDLLWNSSMGTKGSLAFNGFRDLLQLNVRRLFTFSSVNSTYLTTSVGSLRQGSIVGTFTLFFTGLDSFQILLLQEAIENDKYLGKLKIIGSNQTYNTTIVPGSPPLNFTLTPLTSTSITASWEEPPLQHQNGNITGYILFYKEKLLRSEPYSSIATTDLKLTLFGLKVFTEYTFRVLAYNENGNGIATEERYIYTKESKPSQPPKLVSANGTSGFTAIVQWTHITQEQWNGQPLGTLIKFDNLNGHKGNVSVTYPGSSVVLSNLIPITTYVIDACEITAPGPGPCQRVQATTLPSAPSKSPENVIIESILWHNQIKIEWSPINNAFVHGDLLGYKVLYMLNKIAGQNIVGSKTLVKEVHPSLNSSVLSDLQPNAEYSIQILAYNIQGDGVMSAVSYGETCACPSIMYTNFAASAPYIYRDSKGNINGLFASILSNLTQYTCGTCKRSPESQLDYKNNGKNGWAEKQSLREMKKDIDNYVDISFPVFGSNELTTYYGFSFVPVFSHPGVVYFIIKDSIQDQIANMMRGVLETWPIFAVNVVLLTLAGYIIWALEFGNKESDFPDSCLPGVFDGMYWAYITMGTHGYGDLVPRGSGPRLFAIVWILVGMINLAIFTGALTTAITATQVYSDPSLYGVEVAAVHDSVAHKIGIYRNAKVNTKKKYNTIEEVAAALKTRQVRGAIVDIYSAAARDDLFSDSDIIAKRSIRYPSAYGFVLSGDMENAAPQFRSYLNAHSNTILKFIEERTAGLEVNEEHGETVSMFDSHSPLLRKSLITVSSLFVIGFAIGFLYTIHKRKRLSSKAQKDPFEVKHIERVCEGAFSEFTDAWTENVEKMYARHMKERIKFLSKDNKQKKKGVFGSFRFFKSMGKNRTIPSKETILLGSRASFDNFEARMTTALTGAGSPENKTARSQRPSIHSHISTIDNNGKNMPEVS